MIPLAKKPPKVPLRERLAALKLALTWTYRASPAMTFAVLSVTVLGSFLVILEPYAFKLLIDYLTAGTSLSTTQQVGIGIAGILVLYGAARTTQSILWDVQLITKRVHAQKVDRYAARQLMKKISSLDARYFEDPSYYNTLTKTNQNLWRFNEFFWQFAYFVGQALSAAVIIGALFTLHWVVVVLIIAAALPSIMLAFRATEVVWSIFDYYSPVNRHASYYRGLMMENPRAIKEIKLFGLQSLFLRRFDALFTSFTKKQEQAARSELWRYALISLTEGIFSVIAAWFVVRAFLNSEITLGQLTFFWALLFQFSEHARWMVRMLGEFNENATFITPFTKILAFQPTIQEVENARPFPPHLRHSIEFRNVSFTYPGAKQPALKNLSFTIKPGESVALVGANGSGKTTLIKLLTRLYDVDKGEILIDGVNIKEYSLSTLYDNIGVIFQDFMQYEALARENIGFGDVRVLHEQPRVHTSALKSGAWDFIRSLQKRYHTHLGKTLTEHGTELSVGQWQKIALARAFFKDAQILCLDEPTAAVDAKAEYELFRKFERLTKEKTTFLISHRFSTVRMAYHIIVLDKGRIIEQGTHHELLARKGHYARMFALQASAYEDYFTQK